MNALQRRSLPGRKPTALSKSVLFCPDCGRAAPVDEWTLVVALGGETVSCPDCRASLAVVRLADF